MSTAMHPVEFGTTCFCPVFEGPAIAARNEALGFDTQLFGENHTMVADVFAELRDAARATSRIKLLCGPVNFVTRDPGVIASAIAALQLASDGRAICGIARGDSAVAVAGRSPQRQVELRRDLQMLRTYLERGTVHHAERDSRLEWLGDRTLAPVPIEVVCSGPKAIALAATYADRIGLSVGGNPERIRWANTIIDAALDACGRTRAEVRVGAYVPVAITDDRAGGRDAIRSRVAGWAHMSSFTGNDLSTQPDIMRAVSERLRDGYDYKFHRADVPPDNPNTQLIDPDFADWFGIGGPTSYVTERLSELVDLGLSFFGLALSDREAELMGTDVMPAVRAAQGLPRSSR